MFCVVVVFRGTYIDRWPFFFRENVTKLVQYLQLPPGSSGNTAALGFITERYNNSIAALNAAWDINATSFATITEKLPFLTPSAARFADYDDFLGIGVKLLFVLLLLACMLWRA